ncbi:MAG TPA: alpha-amylase family glycosyl hydrolase, partial [Candidatus Limnocylindrales bacterium]|nr:alpha-amylase family glycosyl hydrolase [Candidatus Limnocylindrales bacterium]
GYPDAPPEALDGSPLPAGGHPGWDRPGVHEVHREWRRVADGHGDGRVLVGEVGVEEAERLVDYLRPDELHGAFNFPYMGTPWDGAALGSVIDASLRAHDRVGARPTWLLSNHDATRQVTRLGRPFSGFRDRAVDDLQVADIELGTRRARAAILLTLALPGQAFLYQGEELGLWEVEDLPEASLEDPIWERTGHAIRGRDGCRVPMPWEGQAPPFGFGPRGAKPWLPQPAAWRNLTVEAQAADPASMLSLYRAALRLRREHPGFAAEAFRWLPSPRGVLMFERGGGLRCVANLSSTAWRVPGEARPILASATIDGGLLPVDGAAWLEARDRT